MCRTKNTNMSRSSDRRNQKKEGKKEGTSNAIEGEHGGLEPRFGWIARKENIIDFSSVQIVNIGRK